MLRERSEQERLYLERVNTHIEEDIMENSIVTSMRAEIIELKTRLQQLEGRKVVLTEP
jgi:metal-responsive CopG/Arc/MetJ family transcriptional regulator